jgi:hypothetical protein
MREPGHRASRRGCQRRTSESARDAALGPRCRSPPALKGLGSGRGETESRANPGRPALCGGRRALSRAPGRRVHAADVRRRGDPRRGRRGRSDVDRHRDGECHGDRPRPGGRAARPRRRLRRDGADRQVRTERDSEGGDRSAWLPATRVELSPSDREPPRGGVASLGGTGSAGPRCRKPRHGAFRVGSEAASLRRSLPQRRRSTSRSHSTGTRRGRGPAPQRRGRRGAGPRRHR